MNGPIPPGETGVELSPDEVVMRLQGEMAKQLSESVGREPVLGLPKRVMGFRLTDIQVTRTRRGLVMRVKGRHRSGMLTASADGEFEIRMPTAWGRDVMQKMRKAIEG